MPAYKNKDNGSWYVVTQYTDWTGERKPKCKRGFATRREALEWEQKFQQQNAGDLDMSFEAVPFPVSWTVKMKKKQKETQDILSYHSQAAGCSDKARAKASGGRQPIEECGRTGL